MFLLNLHAATRNTPPTNAAVPINPWIKPVVVAALKLKKCGERIMRTKTGIITVSITIA